MPNFLVIFGDDIGMFNIPAYPCGLMGYQTPNIDRIAAEGMKSTDYHAENSCAVGRSPVIICQGPKRTGPSKVDAPGTPVGHKRDITIAQALKPTGYTNGQFRKNHLGDRDEYLPTAYGFDEFFGNLYHLNADEEPEQAYLQTDPNDPYVLNFSPRGVIKSLAHGQIVNSGSLNRKRMEISDDETTAAAIDYIKRQHDQGTPFFTRMNATRMRVLTHGREGMQGQSGVPGTIYADGIADNSIVIHTTDNGPNYVAWPDAAISPLWSETDTNWEGAFGVPAMIRWPGHIQQGAVSNEMLSGMDGFPTLVAVAGDATIKDALLQGKQVGTFEFKVHLVAMRWGNWKTVLCEQRTGGGLQVWQDPLACLRLPKIYTLRMDPFERADLSSDQYNDWLLKNAYLTAIATMKPGEFLETSIEWPPSQSPASFLVDAFAAEVTATFAAEFA